MAKTLNEVRDDAYQTAKAKGWHDKSPQQPPLEAHMLMVSEIAEATEEARKGTPPIWALLTREDLVVKLKDTHTSDPKIIAESFLKPEGEAVELADTVIRIAHYFGQRGWDLDEAVCLKLEYNKTRPHRHGGKLY